MTGQGSSIIVVMGLLAFGALIATALLPYIPTTNAWIQGLFIAIIQVLLVYVSGLATGKIDMAFLLIGGLVIFIGGIAGGFIADFLGLIDVAATILILAIQTMFLMLFGFIKGTRAPKIS